MKTFETEKHNIPEGATHYGIYGCDTDVYFKEDNGVFLQWHHENWSLSKFAHHKWVKPISQTNIEAPEEKVGEWVCVEGFNYKQVDFSSTLERLDGDTCIDSDLYFAWSNKNIVHISEVSAKELLMNRHKLCKRLETEAERVERERANAMATMIGEFINTKLDESIAGKVAKVCAALYDAGYRKES
jgi:hypothetical protein